MRLSFISVVIFVFWHQICHETQLTDEERKAAKIKASFGNSFQEVIVLLIEKVRRKIPRGVLRGS